MKINKIKVISLSLCSLMLLTACNKPVEETVQTVKKTPVEVVTVAPSDMTNAVSLSGKISAAREVLVTPMANGKAEEIYVLEGDTVKKGQALFKIEQADINRQYNDLKKQYEDTIIINEKTLEVSQKNLDVALKNLEDQRKNIEDLKELYKIGGVSKSDLDAAELGLLQMEPAYTGQEISHMQTKMQMETGIATFETQLESLEDLLSNGLVTAPIDGVITNMNVVEGTIAQQMGQEPLLSIAEADKPQVTIGISETLLPYISAGDIVNITVPSVSNESFEATVRSVSTTTDAMSGLYSVNIDLPVDDKYSIGMFVNAEFKTDEQTSVINVPGSAILSDADSKYVFVVESDKARKVFVTTGLTNGTSTEITSGLIGGETLVTVGAEYLTNDAAVSVVGG